MKKLSIILAFIFCTLAVIAQANRPGTPIGGIIVKGGKNPGGQMMTTTTNDKGEIVLNILEAGNYKFTITAPQTAVAEQAASKDNRTYTGGRKNEEASATSERKGWDGTVKGGSRVAGEPIGGVVVKGGRNASGQTISVVSNGKGEIELAKLEPGIYKFIIVNP
ncbi:MAG: hypothetical protein EOO91_09440 [Pedobacter sp.]|nr:MAG: hypothetical protein EOO91_09440 [Pedobacter sp.]